MVAGLGATAGAAQPLAEAELSAGALERCCAALVQRERSAEVRLESIVVGRQAPATARARKGERAAGALCLSLEHGEDGLGAIGLVDADMRLGEILRPGCLPGCFEAGFDRELADDLEVLDGDF